MKLKNIFALSVFAAAFAACETIDENERFIPIETPDDSTSVDTAIVIKKNVLIEDFTGQKCVNCPLATQTVHSLQESYGTDRVIAVALHGGPLSLPASTPIGLATPESQEYNTKWNVDTWPKGMINRTGGLVEHTSWTAEVVKELQQKANIELSMEDNAYNAETQTLTINVDITNNLSSKAMLQVWLTEDKITRLQFMPDGSANRNYEHNHVFRTSVNGTWGEEINMVAKQTLTQQYEYQFDGKNKWNPENMSVVAFVYSDTEGVMQVIEAPVVKK